ncbi:MAG: hypothetical protein NWQ54_18345 [Paraglaciecola sp.]|uniref:hypothetical protein n=1 Tax=Paraglaciecola sp. TaxID=1920173 RepID=UPI00273F2B29|nr:hypothetical protein [Paraglaciecola sp.]MDP5031291.1 hypothetical protein [Paraglaciecola sp.]MDP5132841.1 hypothetical protein [Paraglaciecola sp.]
MKFKALILCLLGVTLSLTGCMSMPISTMYKMSQLSILGISPDEIKVAIRTNELIEVQNGAAHIRLATKTDGVVGESENGVEGQQLPPFDNVYNFHTQVLSGSESDISSILLEGIEDGEGITILKLSNEDAATMGDALARVKSYKAKGAKVTGGFSIGTSNGCFGNIEKFDELEVDLFLQTDVEDGFVLFLEDIDVIEEMRNRNVELDTSNKCQAN